MCSGHHAAPGEVATNEETAHVTRARLRAGFRAYKRRVTDEKPTPVWYSPHPSTEVQVPERVKPVPAVIAPLGGGVSVLPITIELELGVKEVTEDVVEPTAELPVDVMSPVVVAPEIS